MLKKNPQKDRQDDLFRPRLENIIDPRHELVKLAALIGWDGLEVDLSHFYCAGNACRRRRLKQVCNQASSEYQEVDDPIYIQSAEHKRLVYRHVRDLAEKAVAVDPDGLARRLLILREGAIVTVQLKLAKNPSMDAKAAAKTVLAEALGS